ncbi:MAG TPA: type IA DNA topoisomerase [Candidatus Enterococcus avicola]|uniref:DNA topoisomerase n=1 Tax=Candidatus Enterococcus avicola TaxID=2838561 RepID=A0A9D2F861_9ENTE|nr:type IA DNA topoisomerase [Candidatus Enterococcus avicola]
MITMVLAEKPDQAREYAKALGNSENHHGTLVIKESPYLDGEIHIVAARGHLLEYDYPKIDWKMENLPITNVDLKLRLKKGDADISRRFNAIKNEAKKADEIIIGTDADREGERIAYTILSKVPGALNKAKKRLWINSLTTEGIRKSFGELKEAYETKNFYHEAEARSQSDWFVGFNLSPLVTLDLQSQHRLDRKKGNAMSVGRVQTPTVGLICANDQAIKDFQSQPYWKLELFDSDHEIKFVNETKYFDRDEAQAVLDRQTNEAQVVTVATKLVEKNPPKLFDLTSLQAFCSKKWKQDSATTLKIVQGLYEKKYLTYPRTDLPYITHYEFEYLKKHVQDYQNVLGITIDVVHPEPRKEYVNDKKVKEHFAIVPTEVIPDLVKDLSSVERRVYEAVTKRTLLMFEGNYTYNSTVVTVVDNQVEYTTNGIEVVELGYKKFELTEDKMDQALPKYVENQILNVNTSIKEDKTKAPKRLTESILMGKVFLKYGLGTPATRASIIENIQRRGYVTKNKKTDELFPTDRAFLLVEYLADNEFVNPETTASWEYFLSKIGTGELSQEVFIDAIKEKIEKFVNEAKLKNTTLKTERTGE